MHLVNYLVRFNHSVNLCKYFVNWSAFWFGPQSFPLFSTEYFGECERYFREPILSACIVTVTINFRQQILWWALLQTKSRIGRLLEIQAATLVDNIHRYCYSWRYNIYIYISILQYQLIHRKLRIPFYL